MKKIMLMVLVAFLGCQVCAAAYAGQVHRVNVRVLILTAFPPELKPWLHNMSHASKYMIKGAHSPVWCNTHEVCVTNSGMGRSSSAASLMAIMKSSQLDTANGIVIRSGIAGGSPRDTTVGSAVWSSFVINWDFGHHLLPSTYSKNVKALFMPVHDAAPETLVFDLNERLARLAYGSTKDTKLRSTQAAKQYDSLYQTQVSTTPTVSLGATVSGDDYWAGIRLTDLASWMVNKRTAGKAAFATSAMEEWGDCTALEQMNMLSHYVSVRTVSDFTEEPRGMTAKAYINMNVEHKFNTLKLAVSNAYLVTDRFVRYALSHPSQVRHAMAE